MISLNYGFTALASPIFRQSMSNHSERYREKNACMSAGRGQNESSLIWRKLRMVHSR